MPSDYVAIKALVKSDPLLVIFYILDNITLADLKERDWKG